VAIKPMGFCIWPLGCLSSSLAGHTDMVLASPVFRLSIILASSAELCDCATETIVNLAIDPCMYLNLISSTQFDL
jgi:hypothetical protein